MVAVEEPGQLRRIYLKEFCIVTVKESGQLCHTYF